MFGMKHTARFALGMAACAIFAFAPLAIAAPSNVSAEDQDREWMAPSMAERYGLFADARALANSITDATTRAVTLAKVVMVESRAADAEGRAALEKEARDLVSSLKADGARIAYAEILLDIADASGPKESDRATILQARDRLLDLRKDMSKARDADFNYFDKNRPNDNYNNFMAGYYLEARAYMLMAKVEAPRSKERAQWVAKVGEIIIEMQFDKSFWTRSILDAYILNGDAKIVEGEFLAAVEAYLELPIALAAEGDNTHPLVVEQSMRGYLKAIETLTTVLGSDPASAQRVRREVAKAFATFPVARSIAAGKELEIYDTAASIKLGGDVVSALTILNRLVTDSDPSLRRKAARQLAELAGNPRLSNAQRLDCAKKVASVGDYDVMLLAIHSLHGLMANISTPQEFEAYGPYCYALIGVTYERMHRFMDAAVTFREGATRFRYLRDGNPAWDSSTEKLPKHFLDANGAPICSLEAGTFVVKLETQGDAYDFPRHLASRALDNAKFMAARSIGDDRNNDFAAFVKEYDDWFVPFAGEDQRFRVVKQRGYQRYEEGVRSPGARIESATYLLSTPTSDRSGVVNTAYFAGTAIVLATMGEGQIPSVPTNFAEGVTRDQFFLTGYTLLSLKFDSQLARVDTDFARLPESMRAELRALINQLAGPNAVTDSGRYWWTYAQYALKRALMLQINTDPSRLAALTEGGKTPSIAEGLDAYCEGVNAQFLARAAEDRQANPAMVLSAKVVLQLVYALGNPRINITDPAQKRQQEAALAASMKPEVRDLLRTAWRNLAPHVEAAVANADDKEKDSLNTVMRTMVTGLFREMVDAGRPAEAAEAYEAFRSRYAGGNVSADSPAGRTLRSMAGELYNTLLRVERPRADVFRTGADRLDAIGVQLGKPEAIDFFAAAEYFRSSGAQAKVTDFDKLPNDRQAALIQDAWREVPSATRREAVGAYIKQRIVSQVFGDDAVLRIGGASGATELKFANVISRDEMVKFEEFWEGTKPRYAAMLNEGALVSVTARRKDGATLLANVAGATDASKAMGAEALKVVDAAIAEIKAGEPDKAHARLVDATRAPRPNDPADKDRKPANTIYGDDGVNVLNSARSGLEFAMRDLEWGGGHAFRAELRLWLESRGEALRLEARVPMSRFLEGNARLRTIQGEPLFTGKNADAMADLYTATGDWQNAMQAWKTYFKEQESRYGDPSFIPTNDRFMHSSDAERAEEVRVRLELARATFEVAKKETAAQRRLELLNEALHHARRVYAIMQWRDGVENDREGQWKRNLLASELGRQIERSYIPSLKLYSDLLETFADAGLRPKWQAKYYAQTFGAITKDAVDKLDEKSRFYVLPEEISALYADAATCQYMLRTFGETPGGFYNQFYREAFPKWGRLKIKESAAHAKAGRREEADKASGMVARFVWAEWNNRKDAVFDEASKAYVATLREVFEEARKIVGLTWMETNAKNILDAEAARAREGTAPKEGTGTTPNTPR